ncbi:ATP-binding cassette domain-containing protein [Clostridium sp. HBUAS56017]|uniref:ATP-binding cassette domain-containing protein n=1 Tax=Clostridium sp. HBUAS56017 TaxID=2571128 RepID=UPI001177A174|nr:ATP-binding cassette domain-containing protein [Clostridium sp. HBUAS56017]
MIRIENISKSFKKEVFSNISYTFKKECIYSIFGKNGVGKTTLLNIIAMNILPDTGSINCDNEFDKMMFIDENPFPFEFITGKEFLMQTLNLKNIKTNAEQIEKIAIKFEMLDSLNYMISTYSAGMKYKLLLILIVIIKPKFLILDEPLVEVDILTLEQISDIFKELKKECIILFSTHIPNIAFKISDKVLYLNKDSLIEIDKKFESANEIEEYILNLMKNSRKC